MDTRAKNNRLGPKLAKWTAVALLPLALLLGVADAAMAKPPCWAPAHGYRAKHADHQRHCYTERSHRRHWRRHQERRVREVHVYHHELPAPEPYEPVAAVEPTSTNVSVSVGNGSGILGAAAGAALGGYLGSNIGDGDGQLAATAAGAVAGWLIGGQAASGGGR